MVRRSTRAVVLAGCLSARARPTPPTVSAMPSSWSGPRVSPSTSQPMMAAIGGAKHISSEPSRGPIITNARKRQRSPIVRPTTPEMLSQAQAWAVASVGQG